MARLARIHAMSKQLSWIVRDRPGYRAARLNRVEEALTETGAQSVGRLATLFAHAVSLNGSTYFTAREEDLGSFLATRAERGIRRGATKSTPRGRSRL